MLFPFINIYGKHRGWEPNITIFGKDTGRLSEHVLTLDLCDILNGLKLEFRFEIRGLIDRKLVEAPQ